MKWKCLCSDILMKTLCAAASSSVNLLGDCALRNNKWKLKVIIQCTARLRLHKWVSFVSNQNSKWTPRTSRFLMTVVVQCICSIYSAIEERLQSSHHNFFLPFFFFFLIVLGFELSPSIKSGAKKMDMPSPWKFNSASIPAHIPMHTCVTLTHTASTTISE